MIQDFSLVPRTGRKTALFFNGMYHGRVEFALKRDIPGQYELYRRRDGFEEHLPEGCAVPDFVPTMPGAVRIKARAVSMLITDMEPDQAYDVIRQIMLGRDDDVETAFYKLAPEPDPVREQYEIERWEAMRAEAKNKKGE